MEQYISKSALVTEIKRRISLFKKEKKIEKWSAEASQMNVISLGARIAMLEEVLSFLDTIDVLTLDDIKEMENQAFLHGIDVERNQNIFNDNKKIKI